MKCELCNTKKQMGTSQARIDDQTIVPTWICSTCGANKIKQVSFEAGYVYAPVISYEWKGYKNESL